MNKSRRHFLQNGAMASGLAIFSGFSSFSNRVKNDRFATTESRDTNEVKWPIVFGQGSPRMCIGASSRDSREEMRQIKQMGVDYVLMGGPPIPWTKEMLISIMNRFRAEGLDVINMMIGGHPNSIFGREGRDEEIAKIKESLVAAGAVGLPVVEYNFYAHRLMEGYYAIEGRGGAGMTGFDYSRVKGIIDDSGPLMTTEKLWANLSYFLKAIIPVAEKANVRMALHPNDPPIPISHGHAQIMTTFNDWKRLLEIVNSPSNGMTYDCGVTREIGEDPVTVLRYFHSKDRMNHMHYRNVLVDKPHEKYQEVFLDEGVVNLFAVMKEVFATGYDRGLYPEHPRALDYDREHPGGIKNGYPGGGGYAGQLYNVAYAKAMMQAVASIKGS